MATSARLTLEEFLAMPGIDEGRLELIDGEVCEKAPLSAQQEHVAGTVERLLERSGQAANEPRMVIAPSALFGWSSLLPDVVYCRNSSHPQAEPWSEAPDVVVDILVPGQSRLVMRTRVGVYLAFGVPAVWVVDLERQTIDLYEDGERQTIGAGDTLESAWAPGFSVDVRSLFEAVGEEAAR